MQPKILRIFFYAFFYSGFKENKDQHAHVKNVYYNSYKSFGSSVITKNNFMARKKRKAIS